ncbi:hypothetical protein BT96DRAFT_920934 [Gymnopus androsaceus JB14]|uniref:Uncharacterized protein n=1 Tax=Gymnopus androsaceus JB14 TaxID=1447944 RepID=A0A6A4HJV1_9AGAR|nr:hypothetical protein BT96DRAFT_920934 [Gymnopus androsaceus JB14]
MGSCTVVNGRRSQGLGPSEAGRPSCCFGNSNLSPVVYAAQANLLQAGIGATSRVSSTFRKTLHDDAIPEAIAARVAFIDIKATGPSENCS